MRFPTTAGGAGGMPVGCDPDGEAACFFGELAPAAMRLYLHRSPNWNPLPVLKSRQTPSSRAGVRGRELDPPPMPPLEPLALWPDPARSESREEARDDGFLCQTDSYLWNPG